VVYINDYSDGEGLNFLKSAGVEILRISEEELYKNRKKLKNSIRQNLLPRKEDKDL